MKIIFFLEHQKFLYTHTYTRHLRLRGFSTDKYAKWLGVIFKYEGRNDIKNNCYEYIDNSNTYPTIPICSILVEYC